MKTKKLLSLLLALMMMLSVVPFYASAAEALKAANVTQWPTISYKNGQTIVYYGQTQEMALTINDDEVVTDSAGNVVAGHFEFSNPNNIPNAGSTAKKATIVFVPDDSTLYTGFKKSFSPVTYYVEKVTPVLKDENNPPVVAEAVEAGTALSAVTISGGDMINPYNSDIDMSQEATWQWSNPDTVITESGEYEAVFDATRTNYYTITRNIYVEVKAPEIPFAQITEAPTVEGLTYNPNQTWADVTLTGGKADVAGTFTITKIRDWDMSYWNTQVVAAGTTTDVEVTFTPDDLTAAQPAKTTITVEIAKAPIKFTDENGNEIVPELTLAYGKKLSNDIPNYQLKQYVASDVNVQYIDLYDLEGNELEHKDKALPVGEHILTCRASTQNKNYVTSMLTFKLIVEPATVEMTIQNIQTDEELALNERLLKVVNVNSSDATPKGSYDIYADGVLIADDVTGSFKWTPTQTKEYELKVVYNPTENDPCSVEEFIYNYPVTITRRIKSSDKVTAPGWVRCGDEVTVLWQGTAESFENWVITDAAGNAVDLGVDLTADKIVFIMPDYDLNIEAKGNSAIGGGFDIDNIFDLDIDSLTQGDSECWLINLLRNIIAKIGAFIEELKGTFRGIGDIS